MKNFLIQAGLGFFGTLLVFLLFFPDVLKWIGNLSSTEKGSLVLIALVTAFAAQAVLTPFLRKIAYSLKLQKSSGKETRDKSVDKAGSATTPRRFEPRQDQPNTKNFIIFQLILTAALVIVLRTFPDAHERLGIKFYYHPILSFVSGLLIYCIIFSFLSFTKHVFGTIEQAQVTSFSVVRKFWPRKKHNKILLLVAICLFNPVTEEFLYRGLIVFLLGSVLENFWLSASIGLVLSLVAHLYQGSTTLFFQFLFHGIAIVILFSKLGLIGCIGYHFAGDLLPMIDLLRNWRSSARIHGKAVLHQQNLRISAIEDYLKTTQLRPIRSDSFYGLYSLVVTGFMLAAIFFLIAPIISTNTNITLTQQKYIALLTLTAYVVLANYLRKKYVLSDREKLSDSPKRQTSAFSASTFVQLSGLLVFLTLLIWQDYDTQELLGFKHTLSQPLGFAAGFLIMLAASLLYLLLADEFGQSGADKIRTYENHKTNWPRKHKSKYLAFVTTCIIGPIVDEILLRGVLVHMVGQLSGLMPLAITLGLCVAFVIANRESQGSGLAFNMFFNACSIGLMFSPLGLSASIGAACAATCVKHWIFVIRWRTWVKHYGTSSFTA